MLISLLSLVLMRLVCLVTLLASIRLPGLRSLLSLCIRGAVVELGLEQGLEHYSLGVRP